MKKTLCILMCTVMLSLCVANVTLAKKVNEYDFYFKGEKIATYPNVFNEQGTVLVPARMVLEALGYKLTYNSKKKGFTAKNKSGKSTLEFISLQRKATLNGDTSILPAAPRIHKGVTYIPLKTVGILSKSNVGSDTKLKVAWVGNKPKVQKKKDPDFRQSEWGMSISEVREKEKAKFLASEKDSGFDAIYYQTTVNQLDTLLMYAFHQEELVSSAYYFSPSKQKNTDTYIETYVSIQNMYKQRYGDIMNGYDIYSVEGKDPTSYEEVVAGLDTGAVALISKWEFDETTLELSLVKEKGKLEIKALYRGMKYLNLLDQLGKEKRDI